MATSNSTHLHGNTKHGACLGYRGSPEYQCWQNMKSRCYNPHNQDYYLYGEKGIAVCERWRTSFPHFLDDMGTRPRPQHSIDRIDGTLGYSPDNCRWATPLEQGQNTSRVRLLTHGGETLCVAEWARRLGVKKGTLIMRLRRGWSVERILTPGSEAITNMITHNGETLCISEWARRIGISRLGLFSRLKRGWSVKKALSTPVS